MISQEALLKVLEPKLQENDLYLVDICTDGGNNIKLEIDSMQGFTVDHCILINRAVEAVFDRDVEDYSLEVTSPGLDQPFKVFQQYQKNVGRELDVVLNNGEKRSGLLKSVNEQEILLEKTEKKKIEGKKKKELVTTETVIELNNISKALVKLSF